MDEPAFVISNAQDPAEIAEEMTTSYTRSWARSLQGPSTEYDFPPHFPESHSRYSLRIDDYITPFWDKDLTSDVLMSVRLTYAALLLKDCVEIDPDRLGGVPVLVGTRFPVAQVLGELADDTTVSRMAKNFKLDAETIRSFLRGLAIHLDRPYRR